MATKAAIESLRAECNILRAQVEAAAKSQDFPELDAELAALQLEKLSLEADLARLTQAPDAAAKLEAFATALGQPIAIEEEL